MLDFLVPLNHLLHEAESLDDCFVIPSFSPIYSMSQSADIQMQDVLRRAGSKTRVKTSPHASYIATVLPPVEV